MKVVISQDSFYLTVLARQKLPLRGLGYEQDSKGKKLINIPHQISEWNPEDMRLVTT